MKNLKIKFTSEWDDSISSCFLYQLERKFMVEPYKQELVLYCRWKHQDPWIFSIYLDIENSYDMVYIGSSMREFDPIESVHSAAEKMLHDYICDSNKNFDENLENIVRLVEWPNEK